MDRNKTPYRHIDSEGNKIRVTELNGEYFIGDTENRAENKMIHYIDLNYNNGKLPPKRRKSKNYDHWQESNLDGSFAYNGVTDDF